MNLSLTLNFDTVGELQTFLSGRTTATATVTTAEVVPIARDLVETVADDPLDMAIAPEGQSPTLAEEVNFDDLRAELMATLQTKAKTMDDPQILGAFITGFGVQKFSALPDDMLAPFKAAFISEFGA